MAELNYLAMIGIGIEIVGFSLLVQYARLPRVKHFKKWLERKQLDVNVAGGILENFPNEHVFMMFANYNIAKVKKAVNGFLSYWEMWEKISIVLILIGLFFQLYGFFIMPIKI